MRIFFDTNVLVSAYTDPRMIGVCHKLTSFVLRSQAHQFIVADIILEEFKRVMNDYFKVMPRKINAILFNLRNEEVAPTSKNPPPIPVRDPDDAKVLASALDAEADVLVTGDKDLLSLGDTAEIRIVTPRELLDILKEAEE